MLDVLYTDRGMEHTEPAVADMLVKHQADEAWIESNNGGRGFARNVDDLMWRRSKWAGHAGDPPRPAPEQEARILVAAPFVMNNILYPKDWADKWPDYYRAMYRHQRSEKRPRRRAGCYHRPLAELTTGGVASRTKYASGRGKRR